MRAAWTLATAVTLLAVAFGCREAPKRPNLLFISIDTLRADHLGTYGYPRGTSPGIDALAATACVFESAQSSSSWTLPSLASLMTALSSTTHGCFQVESRLEPEFTTLAEVLRDAGYDTAMVVPHLFLSAQYGLQQGFTHVDDTLIRTGADSDQAISSPGVTSKGLAFVEEKARVQDGIPWFLWLHYFDPHDRYLPHPGVSERFGTVDELDLYDGEIAFTDQHVGRLLARLAELALDQDTIVVIVADHGEEFGEHGFRRHGYSLYQSAVRIPLIVRAPGLDPRRVSDVVSGVDVMPSLLALVGVAPPPGLEGRDFGPLMRGSREPDREALSEVRWHEGQDLRALRAGDCKLVEQRGRAEERDFVFDLGVDPGETRDLASAPGACDARRLGDRLGHRLARALELARGYPVPERYEPSPGDRQRLKALGYVSEDEPSATPTDGRRKP